MRSVWLLACLVLSAGACARVSGDLVRKDLERLVGPAVEVVGLDLKGEQKLGRFGDRTECFSGGALVTLSAVVRARVRVRNFRTDPDFEKIIRRLESGDLRLSPEELERYGAMFRLAEMSAPSWKDLPPGGTLTLEPTFEYLQRCTERELRFERALGGRISDK